MSFMHCICEFFMSVVLGSYCVLVTSTHYTSASTILLQTCNCDNSKKAPKILECELKHSTNLFLASDFCGTTETKCMSTFKALVTALHSFRKYSFRKYLGIHLCVCTAQLNTPHCLHFLCEE